MATQIPSNPCVRGGKDRNLDTCSILSARTRYIYVQGQLLSTSTFSCFPCQLVDELFGHASAFLSYSLFFPTTYSISPVATGENFFGAAVWPPCSHY